VGDGMMDFNFHAPSHDLHINLVVCCSTSASEESNGHRLGLPLPQPAGKGSYRPATTANWEVSLLQAMNSLDMLPGHDGTPAHRFQTVCALQCLSSSAISMLHSTVAL
jgi:hypothetical protein